LVFEIELVLEDLLHDVIDGVVQFYFLLERVLEFVEVDQEIVRFYFKLVEGNQQVEDVAFLPALKLVDPLGTLSDSPKHRNHEFREQVDPLLLDGSDSQVEHGLRQVDLHLFYIVSEMLLTNLPRAYSFDRLSLIESILFIKYIPIGTST
jgi:hypothetical protein